MAVEQSAHGIANRFVRIVSFDQDRVEAGNAATRCPPGRSNKRGSMANTLGVKPRLVGGSPAARPISRWARARRERVHNQQHVLPSVAEVFCDRGRREGGSHAGEHGSSLVATTTTLLASPVGPKSRSMNSFTSRPRSPISAITLTSADVYRAIIPKVTLLPTPDPAKIPIR